MQQLTDVLPETRKTNNIATKRGESTRQHESNQTHPVLYLSRATRHGLRGGKRLAASPSLA